MTVIIILCLARPSFFPFLNQFRFVSRELSLEFDSRDTVNPPRHMCWVSNIVWIVICKYENKIYPNSIYYQKRKTFYGL